MSIEVWVYYVIAILVLTASPGPCVFLCITKSVTEGFSASIYTAMGSLTAIVGILTLSFTGLGVIISNSEFAFNLIKWVGAVYLIYLGLKALTSKESSFLVETQCQSNNSNVLSNFVNGFMVGASNPKAIVFFTALFPQFINPIEPLLFQYIVFVSTFATFEFLWLLTYAYLGLRSRRWLSSKGRVQIFNKITGGIFISAGILLSSTSKEPA